MVKLNIDLPEGFLNEEVRCDYFISSHMKEVWAVELDLLSQLLSVCAKYGIKVFAGDGTLLGAVRHKGFIPWDDDIDVMMFRDDYDKLCRIAEKEFKEPYFFQTEYTDPGSLRGHAQIRRSDTTGILKREVNSRYSFNQGIFIDVFPLDNIIEDERKFIFYRKYTNLLKRLARKFSNLSGNSITSKRRSDEGGWKAAVRKFVTLVNARFGIQRKIYAIYEKGLKRFNKVKTKNCGYLCLEYSRKWLKYPEDLQEVLWVPFEFINIPIPAGYDRILKETFGEYEEIVKSGNVHGGVIFDTSVSYKEYFMKLSDNQS